MFRGFDLPSFLLGGFVGAWVALGYAIRRYKRHHPINIDGTE